MEGETFWVRDPAQGKVIKVSEASYKAFMDVRANKGSEADLIKAIREPHEVLSLVA